MATYKVHMLAYQPEYCVREVEIPDELDTLDAVRSKVWEQGQNMFCNVPGICSVSAGDVMEINAQYHLILNLGFVLLPEDLFNAYKAMGQDERRRVLWEQRPQDVLEKIKNS